MVNHRKKDRIHIVKLNLKLKKNSSLLHEVNSRVASAKRCIIITGAGISCSGGIPDFSSSNGLYSMIKCKYLSTFRSGKDLFDARLLRTHDSIKAFNVFMDNLEELVGLHVDWQFEKVKNCQAQVVQLHGTVTNLQCNFCTNVYSFTTKYCNSFKQGEAPNCPGCVIRGLEISQLAAHDQGKADCLIIMGTSLRILGVKSLIKNFARAIHGHGGFVILVNATDVVTKEWNGIIDYQIEGTCDEWVKLVGTELSNVKTARLSKRKLAETNNKSQIGKKRKERTLRP
ncbi:42500_t:CDS:2 [Gigaspora margarita]|uniref:42500_t:CDS:1 n=1 Tax=Gigaspora margarita TaxID=4874 RepID=A0ABN7US93_GIGMA|nr:42500_t:CDS:2 [Gigaspora margarita]